MFYPAWLNNVSVHFVRHGLAVPFVRFPPHGLTADEGMLCLKRENVCQSADPPVKAPAAICDGGLLMFSATYPAWLNSMSVHFVRPGLAVPFVRFPPHGLTVDEGMLCLKRKNIRPPAARRRPVPLVQAPAGARAGRQHPAGADPGQRVLQLGKHHRSVSMSSRVGTLCRA